MTPSTALATLTADIAARVATRLPGLRTCKGVSGRFDLDKLKSGPFPTPTVLISRISMNQSTTYAGTIHSYDIQMAAYVITTDQLGLMRDEGAAAIAQALLRLIPDQTWGLEWMLGSARDVAENLIVTEQTEKAGINLTAITWTQSIGLDNWPEDEVIPLQIYVSTAPDTGVGNEDDYDQVGGQP